MNGIAQNINGLVIKSTSQLLSLTKGQKSLLDCIRLCVENRRALDWDMIVNVYTDNIRTYYYDGWIYLNGERSERRILTITDEYKKQSAAWTYTLRPIIRQWLLSNIGILVLKNQLIIIPVIQID